MEQNNEKQKDRKVEKDSAAASESSVDRKNESAVNRTPTATERVKPNAGDGLANEGTNVSYDEQR